MGAMLAIAMTLLLAASQQPRVVSVSPRDCRHGLEQQPNGPYAVFSFCDDALGTSLGLIYFAPGFPHAPAWSLDKRFWQDASWSRDVTSYAWLSQNRLLVATSEVYGTGALYLLDVDQRTVRRLYPQSEGPPEIVVIRSVAPDESVEIFLENSKTSRKISPEPSK